MQSQNSSKTTKKKAEERPSLPWGLGSARFKGRSWWLVYRTKLDEVREENSGTADASEARRILAQRALPRARAAVELLERLANGEDQSDAEAGASARRPAAGGSAKAAGGNRGRSGKGGKR